MLAHASFVLRAGEPGQGVRRRGRGHHLVSGAVRGPDCTVGQGMELVGRVEVLSDAACNV
ncbi:hypothetical protein [Streptomyces sp. NPDC059970]|uniref:hypothetical protein n=1 Tax=Streptomyces sp. NPDC059970 TaxID=3347019 RepID=UPI0036CA171C